MKISLIICFTLWLIATECLVVDLIKYNARLELLEQAARSLHATPAEPQRDNLEHL
jgi:hypothetical protein